MDLQQVYWLLGKENKAEKTRNEDRRIALVRLGFGGEANGDFLAQDALGILLERGDVQGASEMLAFIDEPQLVEDMLIQRRFARLWPALERRAGPRLELVRASAVNFAEREYAESPQDNEKLALLANALRHSGRHSEAIALRAKLPATSAAMASADEHLGWAVNNVALALHEAGRADEADQLFALLNDAPMNKAQWRVNMVINRLELLVDDGKFDRAAQLLDRTEETARTDGNPYARQLVRRLRYCTMTSLGRGEEAATLLPELLKNGKDAGHATVDALLCAGDEARAEALILEQLEVRDFQGQLVRALQPKPLTSDDPSIWAERWFALRQRPQIAAVYARLGRDMPEALLVPPPTVMVGGQ